MTIDGVLFGDGLVGAIRPNVSGVLARRFIVPPFSVLNAREGEWQRRKAAWLGLGLEGDLGRDVVAGGGNKPPAMDYRQGQRGDGRGRAESSGITAGYGENPNEFNSSSIFDPVLAELAYTWFCPPGGRTLDPFAGGACRGVVASVLGYRYAGVDLRPEQIEANRRQAERICPNNMPTWACGDAAVLVPQSPPADFLFSCPPYGDLERYSDDPRDLSAMSFDAFRRAYTSIIGAACERLENNRFACFVVGDFRDRKTGAYRNFVGGTVSAFARAGLMLYGEMILITAVGSLSIRVQKQFDQSRKIGKTHQNVLVFLKGDPRAATAAITGGEK